MLKMHKENHVEHISETQARTIKNESRKGASGRCGWMMSVREMEVEEEVMSRWIALLFLAALCVRRDLAERSDVVYAANSWFFR